MTKIKTIEEIKNEIAQQKGYPSWVDYYNWIAREGERSDVVAQLIEGAITECFESYHSQFEQPLESLIKRVEVHKYYATESLSNAQKAWNDAFDVAVLEILRSRQVEKEIIYDDPHYPNMGVTKPVEPRQVIK